MVGRRARSWLGEGPVGAVVGGAAIGNSIANARRYYRYGCAFHYFCRHHYEYDGWKVDGGGLEVPARSGRRERPKAKIRGEKIISALYDILISFIRGHESLAAPIVFGLAFGESIAFVSLLLPATVILFGVGGLIGATGIGFWPIWLGAALGAVLGDWLSYWLGLHYKHEIAHMWPLSRRPDLLPKGEAFFRRWGVAGVFLGRFFGPLRSAVPLVAGICAMPLTPFQIANVASALVWATGILAPGAVGVKWLV